MQTVRELLLEVDMELEDYTGVISRARDPALTPEDRLTLVEASEVVWKRLEAAHKQLERGVCVADNDAMGTRTGPALSAPSMRMNG